MLFKRRIKDFASTATEADLKTGNYLALDGNEGTKRLPAEAVAKAEYIVEMSSSVGVGGNFPNVLLLGQNGKSFRVIIKKETSGTFRFTAYASVSGSLVNLGVIECVNPSEHEASSVITMPEGSNERLILNNGSGYELTVAVAVYGGMKKEILDNYYGIKDEKKRAENYEAANDLTINSLKETSQRKHVFRYFNELENSIEGVFLYGLDSTKQYALRYYVSGSFKTWQLFVLTSNWEAIANIPTSQQPKSGVYEFVKISNGEKCGYISLRKEPPSSTTDHMELRTPVCFNLDYNAVLSLAQKVNEDHVEVVEINVNQAGSGDFTTIDDALTSIEDSSKQKQYKVFVHEGTYNIEAEVFGGDYSQQKEGLFIPNFVSLIGVGKRENIIIDGRLDSSNINISQSTAFSTINSVGNVNLENLTIYAKNCRYCWHSDGGWTNPNPGVKMTAKNCHFKNFLPDSTDASRLWQDNSGVGFGLQSGEVFEAEHCVFETEGAKNGVPAFGSHNWDKRTLMPFPCIQKFVSCEFKNTQKFAFRTGWLGSGSDDQVSFVGCKFSYDGSNSNIWLHDESNQNIPCDYSLYLAANKNVHITADKAYKKLEVLTDNT